MATNTWTSETFIMIHYYIKAWQESSPFFWGLWRSILVSKIGILIEFQILIKYWLLQTWTIAFLIFSVWRNASRQGNPTVSYMGIKNLVKAFSSVMEKHDNLHCYYQLHRKTSFTQIADVCYFPPTQTSRVHGPQQRKDESLLKWQKNAFVGVRGRHNQIEAGPYKIVGDKIW